MESSKHRVKENKPKARNSSYKNRKLGLKKKLHELTTLCDIDGAIIFYDPNQNKPEICSENLEVANNVIKKYIGLTAEQKAKGSLSLFDIFGGKKKGLEKDSGKLRNKNCGAEYSSWDPVFDTMSDDQLRKVLSSLTAPIEGLKRKIEEKRLALALIDYSLVLTDQVSSYQPSDAPVDQQNQWHQTMMNEDFMTVNNVDYVLPNQSIGFDQTPLTTWVDGVDYASSSGGSPGIIQSIGFDQIPLTTWMDGVDYASSSGGSPIDDFRVHDIPTMNNEFDVMTETNNEFDVMTEMNNEFDVMTETNNEFDVMTETNNNDFDVMTEMNNKFDVMAETNNDFDVMTVMNNKFDLMTEMNSSDLLPWDVPTVNNQFHMLSNDFGPYNLPSPPRDDSWLTDIFPVIKMKGYDCGRRDQGSLSEMFMAKPMNPSAADQQLVY